MAAVRLDGTVLVEGEEVGSLNGFTFIPNVSNSVADSDERAMILSAARKGLPDEIERRVSALVISASAAFKVDEKGVISWRDAEIAKMRGSEQRYQPHVQLTDSDLLTDEQKTRIAERLSLFVTEHVQTVLGNLAFLAKPDELQAKLTAESAAKKASATQAKAEEASIEGAETPKVEAQIETASAKPASAEPLSGAAKGVLFQLYEGFGTVSRNQLHEQIKSLEETDKPQIARFGIRLGVENLFMPEMLKPAAIKLRALLFSLYHHTWPENGIPPEGRVSFDDPNTADAAYWRATGYQPLGGKVMRVDMIERVSALVRAAARSGPFAVSEEMMSLAGMSRDEMGKIILDLGMTAAGEQASEDPEKPAIPLYQRIRQQHRNKEKAGPHKKKPAHKNNKRQAHGNSQKPRHNNPKQAENKPIDPNSPFAVLAALKK